MILSLMNKKIIKTKKTKIKLHILLVLILLCTNSFTFAANNTPYKILLFNSYHLGYKWSDEIYSGICTKFEASNHPYEIDIEYMDTQRIANPEYLTKLKLVYE